MACFLIKSFFRFVMRSFLSSHIFPKLKYAIGLSGFHSYKGEFIEQEIWAKLIACNLTETIGAFSVCNREKTLLT